MMRAVGGPLTGRGGHGTDEGQPGFAKENEKTEVQAHPGFDLTVF